MLKISILLIGICLLCSCTTMNTGSAVFKENEIILELSGPGSLSVKKGDTEASMDTRKISILRSIVEATVVKKMETQP